ncbi:MAG: SRPBCC family protein [Chitinophagaceae bacterium]|nr:SRPBCC domain-containing protein [Flavisolibacter sp.]
MSDLLTHFVETQMLIRKPIATVFDAFIDPSVTKNFWFTKGSDKLETGKTITWEWEMYNISTKVYVKEIQPNKKISIEWNEPATVVDFEFTPLDNERTYVVIRNYGFHQTGDELLSIIRDSTGGFTTVLDGLKAYLEHNINLNLIMDKFPKEVMQHGK